MNPFGGGFMDNNQIGFSNPVIKEFIDLKKGSKDDTKFTLEGISIIKMLLDSNIKLDVFIYCDDYMYSDDAISLKERCLNESGVAYSVSKKVFDKLTDLDGPDGFVGIASLPEHDFDQILQSKDRATFIVLDGLETSGNIGTIYRTADGLGIDGILVCNRRAKITSNKVVKASMGALFYIPTKQFDDVDACYKWLEDRDFNVYLTDTRAEKNYFEIDFKNRVALVAGCERYGIDKKWYKDSAKLIKIPMLGKCDSLNVAVATVIMASEVVMQQKFNIGER